MTSIPMFDLTAVTDVNELSKIAQRVISSKHHILGQAVETFEKSFADYVGVNYCLGVANGTDAIEIALIAAGVEKDDLVATVANAGFYTSTSINKIGAKPLYIDINEDDLLMNVIDLKEKISKNKIRAVVMTHLFGLVANVKEIFEICKKNKIILIEDCAQAHGAQISGQKVGSFGDLASFSFYPTKNLGAVGDAGAITTNSIEFASNIKAIRQYGWTSKYSVEFKLGSNSRLDEIQAAFLTYKLEKLDIWNQSRIDIAKKYVEGFKGSKVKTLKNVETGVAHLFVVKTESRNDLIKYLESKHINSAIHYPIPDHQQTISISEFEKISLPVTEAMSDKILSLPIYPGMPIENVERVISSVKEFIESASK
jgi:dTDP-3-amino-2,3,6-trideoxy-4-keto-D-glucose/dTDP-3-amino-3,4,6-trideoxy-alpha-D-glucose/dTDP-2,6-dideoxy-D-kanosamine transaminase